MVALNDISTGKNWHAAKTCTLGARSATAGFDYLGFSLTFCVDAVWCTFKRQFPPLLEFAGQGRGNGNVPPLAENRHKAWKRSSQVCRGPRPPCGASWLHQTPPSAVRAEKADGLQSESSHCPARHCVIYCRRMTGPLFRTWKERTEFIAHWRKGKLHRSVAIPSCTTYC